MYAELLGLPASGKSTIMASCKAAVAARGMTYVGSDLLAKLEAKNREIPPNIRKHSHTRALYRSEEFRSKHINLAEDSDLIFGDNLPARSFYYMNAAQYMAFRSAESAEMVRFVDEGFLHRAIYGISRETNWQAPRIEEFVQKLPPIDLVLYTKLDPEFGYERVKDRLFGRIGDRFSADQVEKRLLSAHGDLEAFKRRSGIMDLVCKLLQDNGTEVEIIDTSCTIEETEAQTKLAIDHQLSQAG